MESARSELDSLFYLSLALHHINRDIERKFRLSLVQLFVLLRLQHMPASSSQTLAAAVGVHPSTLTQTLRRLCRKEYVFVTDDPVDSRRKLISLTRRGRDATEGVYGDIKRILQPTRTGLDNLLGDALSYLTRVREQLRHV